MVKKKDNRVYIDRWLEIKPYDKQVITDSYYLKLCNEVKQSMVSSEYYFVLGLYYDKEDIDDLACFLTSYFEDLISGTQIWNTFVRLHKKLYGKWLPFYETNEYFEEEINLQDISFLIWYYTNTFQTEKFIHPNNEFIFHLSENVFQVFDRAWEYAPENESLKKIYQIAAHETDFYLARHLIDNVLFRTYLFYTDTGIDLNESLLKVIEEYSKDQNIMTYLNESRDHSVHNFHTRLLGFTGKEWVSEILKEEHPLSIEYKNMSKKIRGYFLYKGQDHYNIHLEHIASGRKFDITKKSIQNPEQLKEIDTIVFMGIARWMNEWWHSGIMVQSAFNPDVILDQKNSIESRKEVDFLDQDKKEVREILDAQLMSFRAFNNNEQIAFMESGKVDSFLKEFFAHHNQSLKLSEEAEKEAKQRAIDEGYLGNMDENKGIPDVEEDALVFFNPQSGIEIAFGVNSAFPARNNPFYDEKDSEDAIMTLFFNENISKELVMFCIDNFQHDLGFFRDKNGELFLEHLDFLLRFFKKGKYFTKPAITLTGKV
ncbi:MAG: DUF3843 family protein [Bacteroidetes bacterium]|nr:MAG: DUF3843 family protein [Bacteroidota bacterium]